MKITRLYSGNDGDSHFDEIDVRIGRLQRAKGFIVRQTAPGDVQDWHPAPRRQYVITLAGESEIEIGDGTRRRFRAGDIMLADDTTGRGHVTRTVGDRPRVCLMISNADIRDLDDHECSLEDTLDLSPGSPHA